MQCSWVHHQPCHPWYVLPDCVSFVSHKQAIDENKTQIAKSGALVPLTRLAKSKDMRVQRNATGALLNMTHSGTPACTAVRIIIN